MPPIHKEVLFEVLVGQSCHRHEGEEGDVLQQWCRKELGGAADVVPEQIAQQHDRKKCRR